MQRWHGLYHFDKVFEMKFNNSSKEEDLAKVSGNFQLVQFHAYRTHGFALTDSCFCQPWNSYK